MLVLLIIFIIVMCIIIAISLDKINSSTMHNNHNNINVDNMNQLPPPTSNNNLTNYTINNNYVNNLSNDRLSDLLSSPQVDYTLLYKKKQYLLTKQELKFFRLLKPTINKYNMNLFAQVALYEIVNNTEYKEFNKIKSKTIDFVIADSSCKIMLCIELDDITHKRPDRIKRDSFINSLFEQLEIPLLRIPVQSYYNINDLENSIREKCNIQ